MTPSNPTRLPLIFRIFDSFGSDHTVAPTPHTHGQDEVSGLTKALDAKANAEDVTASLATKADKVSGATNNNFAALDGNGNLKDSGKKASDFAAAGHTHSMIQGNGAGSVSAHNGVVNIDAPRGVVIQTTEEEGEGGGGDIEHTIEINGNNAANLERALQTPDSAPTENSQKLALSGGIYAAIQAAKVKYLQYGDSELADNALDMSSLAVGVLYLIFFASEVEDKHVNEFFKKGTLSGNDAYMYINDNPLIENGEEFCVLVYRDGYQNYVIYQGKIHLQGFAQ